MELQNYINLLKRWMWVIILGALLGALGGYMYSRYQTPMYQASTKVLIQESSEAQLANLYGSGTQQGSDTFTELLVTRPVLQATSERLGYHISAGRVQVEWVGASNMIEVTVQHEDPQKAADAANTLVAVYVEQNEVLQTNRYKQTEENLEEQQQQVEEQISALQAELTTAAQANTDAQISEVSQIMNDLEVEVAQLEEEIIRITYSGAPIEVVERYTGVRSYVTPTPSIDQRIQVSSKNNRVEELKRLLDQYQAIYVELSLSRNTSGDTAPGSADAIRTALSLYQQIYSNLLSNLETIRLARVEGTTSAVQVEEALPPSRPFQPDTSMNMILGVILGLAITGVGAYLVEYLDDRLHSPDEVAGLFELPILGYIGQIGGASRSQRGKILFGLPPALERVLRSGKAGLDEDLQGTEGSPEPFVLTQPRSPVSEAFRTLRTNLEFAGIDKHLKSILVTSPSVGEGKTTVAVNLATVMAQAGKRVVLVDADLRRPQVHKALGLHNRLGLSDLLLEYGNLADVIKTANDGRLRVITSGTLPPNPVEVLNSEKMAQVLETLVREHDLVILDGPPFVLADASVLSARVNGVLPVVRIGKTEARAGVIMLDQLARAGAQVLGLVVNGVHQKEQNYYYQSLKDYDSYSYDTAPGDPAVNEVK